ncbi:homoserine kinase [Acrocarpospora phusangensis]|uniref:Homoserine kinase n=1 Tax=Acrocarpospora phusangensis TaxID=1070424 RepID=A0A919QKC7_9ACTN|nr:homoserine kinase [Acrocarpospora phusangensis]GIH29278.1 homoserine kinase [Acrocarpospora phusangensis]
MHNSVLVRVPATSANLGPGFDTLGLALDLHDEVEAELTGDGVEIEIDGHGAGEVDSGEGHLIVATMRKTFDALDAPQPKGIRLRCRNRIPHARGLGSSSAAIVAGVLAARALSEAPWFGDDRALELAAQIEGHPDNVAPCLYGGFTIAYTERGRPRAVALPVHEQVRPVVLIPDFRLATEAARGLLPPAVPHGEAAANAGNAALLVHALTQRPDLLMTATEDHLHQKYRAPAMPRTAELVKHLRSVGVPAVVSGAGPTILAFSSGSAQDLIAPEVGTDWHIQPLNVDPAGACVQFPETR